MSRRINLCGSNTMTEKNQLYFDDNLDVLRRNAGGVVVSPVSGRALFVWAWLLG